MFLRDPRVPPHTNASERILRGAVIARPFCLGPASRDGARMAGLLFSVLATVRLAERISTPRCWTVTAPVPATAAGRRSGWTRGCPGSWTRSASGNSGASVGVRGTDHHAFYVA